MKKIMICQTILMATIVNENSLTLDKSLVKPSTGFELGAD